MFDKNEYDRNVNTFSNQCRLYQVEYAMKAVEQGCTTEGWSDIGSREEDSK